MITPTKIAIDLTRIGSTGSTRLPQLELQQRSRRSVWEISRTFEPVGAGVSEDRIDFGPGYRIYFGKDGDRLIILLGGGTKKRQQADINTAIGRWQTYKERKKLQARK